MGQICPTTPGQRHPPPTQQLPGQTQSDPTSGGVQIKKECPHHKPAHCPSRAGDARHHPFAQRQMHQSSQCRTIVFSAVDYSMSSTGKQRKYLATTEIQSRAPPTPTSAPQESRPMLKGKHPILYEGLQILKASLQNTWTQGSLDGHVQSPARST